MKWAEEPLRHEPAPRRQRHHERDGREEQTVLALETSTARLPRALEPRPEPAGVDGSGSSAGPVPRVVKLLL
ncbi:MAG: hypothetical protein M3534_05780 [Actinomycetota bacterium]|nr:hypothetical protein [Actinomycetota bacterium]